MSHLYCFARNLHEHEVKMAPERRLENPFWNVENNIGKKKNSFIFAIEITIDALWHYAVVRIDMHYR